MIFFDNAATTAVKPPEVAEAVARARRTASGAWAAESPGVG